MKVMESFFRIRWPMTCPVETFIAAMMETVPWRTYSNSRRESRPGAAGTSGCLRVSSVLGYECQQLFPEGSRNGTETTMYWPCTPNSAVG